MCEKWDGHRVRTKEKYVAGASIGGMSNRASGDSVCPSAPDDFPLFDFRSYPDWKDGELMASEAAQEAIFRFAVINRLHVEPLKEPKSRGVQPVFRRVSESRHIIRPRGAVSGFNADSRGCLIWQ